jgi:hypothetical protein
MSVPDNPPPLPHTPSPLLSSKVKFALASTIPPKKEEPKEVDALLGLDLDSPALKKFLLNPNSYVLYVLSQLLSDGLNITQWIDSLNDLASLLFAIKKFFADEAYFKILNPAMDRCLLHVIKASIAMDIKPIIKDANSSLEAFWTLKKNFHKATCSRQLELIGSLVKLNGPAAPAHFNQFFSTVSELAALGVDISQEAQGLFFQVLKEPPAGTTNTQLNNLVLAALEKSALALGPRDVQVIYNCWSCVCVLPYLSCFFSFSVTVCDILTGIYLAWLRKWKDFLHPSTPI